MTDVEPLIMRPTGNLEASPTTPPQELPMPKVCVEYDCNDDGTPTPPAVRTFSTTVGNGVDTVFNVQHNLNTSDAWFTLRNTVTGELDAFDVAVNASDPNRAVLTFATAPAANAARVNVLAGPAPAA